MKRQKISGNLIRIPVETLFVSKVGKWDFENPKVINHNFSTKSVPD